MAIEDGRWKMDDSAICEGLAGFLGFYHESQKKPRSLNK
jgi:hypothetical protein